MLSVVNISKHLENILRLRKITCAFEIEFILTITKVKEVQAAK